MSFLICCTKYYIALKEDRKLGDSSITGEEKICLRECCAAAFAATSSPAFPVETETVLLVWAWHLHTDIAFGSNIASRKAATLSEWWIVFHNWPQSWQPKMYCLSVYSNLHASVSAINSATCTEEWEGKDPETKTPWWETTAKPTFIYFLTVSGCLKAQSSTYNTKSRSVKEVSSKSVVGAHVLGEEQRSWIHLIHPLFGWKDVSDQVDKELASFK